MGKSKFLLLSAMMSRHWSPRGPTFSAPTTCQDLRRSKLQAWEPCSLASGISSLTAKWPNAFGRWGLGTIIFQMEHEHIQKLNCAFVKLPSKHVALLIQDSHSGRQSCAQTSCQPSSQRCFLLARCRLNVILGVS